MDNNSEDAIFKNMPFIWRITLGVLIGLSVMLTIFVAVYSSERSLIRQDSKVLQKEVFKLDQDLQELQKVMHSKNKEWEDARKEEAELRKQAAELKDKLMKIKYLIDKQTENIAILSKQDFYWLLGFVPSVAFSGFMTKQAIDEYNYVKSLLANNTKLSNELRNLLEIFNQTKKKYLHYYSFFNATHNSLVENMLIQSMKGNYNMTEVFRASRTESSLINLEALMNAYYKANKTTTVLVTEDDWVVAAIMNKPWIRGLVVKDVSASLVAVNRGERAFIKPECQELAGYIDMDKKFMKFGSKDMVVYENFTGMTKADSAYQPFNKSIPVNEFYVGKPNFVLKAIYVYQHNWVNISSNFTE